jgi:hypothetical protein
MPTLALWELAEGVFATTSVCVVGIVVVGRVRIRMGGALVPGAAPIKLLGGGTVEGVVEDLVHGCCEVVGVATRGTTDVDFCHFARRMT